MSGSIFVAKCFLAFGVCLILFSLGTGIDQAMGLCVDGITSPKCSDTTPAEGCGGSCRVFAGDVECACDQSLDGTYCQCKVAIKY